MPRHEFRDPLDPARSHTPWAGGPDPSGGPGPVRNGFDLGTGEFGTGEFETESFRAVGNGSAGQGSGRLGDGDSGLGPGAQSSASGTRGSDSGQGSRSPDQVRSHGVRRLAGILFVVGLLVPYVVAVALFWNDSGSQLGATAGEREGVTYLRPLVQLLAVTADQQSLDVAGTPGDGEALRAAIRELDVVDAQFGDSLGTRDRWSALRQRLGGLSAVPPSPESAYQAFGQAVDLLTALIGTVGDRSGLILDPDLPSYYLMDATVIRVPDVLVSAGRLSDLAHPSALSVPSAPEVAAESELMRRAAALLDTGMRKSFAATRTRNLSAALVSSLDGFGDAVTAMAPPSPVPGGITDTGGRLAADRQRVRTAALQLESAALTQLDALLDVRERQLSGQRRWVGAVALGGIIACLPAGWLQLRRRRPGAAGATGGRQAGVLGSAPGGSPAPVSEPAPTSGTGPVRGGAGAVPRGGFSAPVGGDWARTRRSLR
ncbi:MAG TPA: hypothetical protein VFP72_19480 [Kineosporiaceae bacterium]|nr:hypothetical protein [Kineosporiaceae bacterium]